MSKEYTKGPWEVVDGTTTGKAVIAPNEPKVRRNVAMVGGQNREGNACLIAAAPDLLEAAIWAESALSPFSKEPAEKSGISRLRAAIAKARGE